MGTIFELGPDGYGYIIDQREPGRNFAFRVEQLLETAVAETKLEGRAVRFDVAPDGRTIQNVMLARPAI
jgi:hypothetical protein